MSEKRTIKASDIVKDLREGLSDHELMEKYKLSIKGLESIFRKLEDSKTVKRSELYGRMQSFEDTVNLASMRKLPRNFLTLALRIYEHGHPSNEGELLDVNEKGVGVRGLEVKPDQTLGLVIVASGFVDIRDIRFEAVCRWRKQEQEGAWASGFEITSIPDEDLTNLRKIISGLAM